MSNKLCLVLFLLLTATILLVACTPASTPTAAPAAPLQPTTAPAGTAAALPNGSSIKVGLVTDTGGVNDQAFNQSAWAAVQKASQEMGFQAKFLESRQPSDYETNIDTLATEGYNVIITVGSPMGDATALKAKQYPDIKFAIHRRQLLP
jgi:basic membrane protein A and related proteins